MPDIKKNETQAKSRQKAIGVNPRVTFGFLLILSVATFGLGLWQIGNNIKAPFQNTNQESQSGIEDGDNNILSLQGKDTDNDGLNDYEEMYVYNTSPYLPDSDSDGFSDAEEIKSGNDPNCPAGQDCRGGTYAGNKAAENDSENNLVNPFGAVGDVKTDAERKFSDLLQPAGGQTSVTSTALQELQKMDASELRKLLLESGQIDETALNQIDDQTLMQAYRESLGQQ